MLDSAFILAAGLGTRMRPLTEHSAKPLLHFRGERLIERHLQNLAKAQIKQVVINCCWQGQQLRQLLGDGRRFNLEIRYSCEDQTPLETASGIARASKLLGDKPFLLLNGDIWTDLDLQQFQNKHAPPCIVLVRNPAHNPTGDFSLRNSGGVRNTGENMLTYAGVAVLQSELINSVHDTGAKLGDALRKAADSGDLNGHCHTGEWFDIGRPSALQSPKDHQDN